MKQELTEADPLGMRLFNEKVNMVSVSPGLGAFTIGLPLPDSRLYTLPSTLSLGCLHSHTARRASMDRKTIAAPACYAISTTRTQSVHFGLAVVGSTGLRLGMLI